MHGQSHPIIYAQIPPFYWAFSLEEDVATVMGLSPHFPAVIEAMNTELAKKRDSFFSTEGSRAHAWQEGSVERQREIQELRKKWDEENSKLTEMKRASLDTPQGRKELKSKQEEVDALYKKLEKMIDKHLPRDKLTLFFSYLPDHCLTITVDAPIFF